MRQIVIRAHMIPYNQRLVNDENFKFSFIFANTIQYNAAVAQNSVA